MSENNIYTLLITACISPNADNFKFNQHFRIDPQIRMEDYIRSFKYWLHYQEPLIVNLVFIENSGYDISPLKKMAEEYNQFNRNIEYIQINATAIPKGIHYGYSELEMIDEAIKRSKLLHETPFFIKVTGRLFFPRLSKLIRTENTCFNFLADSRDYAFGAKQKRYIVTTLLIIKFDFYKRKLLGVRHDMREGVSSHFETLYYNLLKPLSLKDKSILLRFPFNVDPVGYGAHWNVNYNSVLKRVESTIRGIARVLLPSFRI